MRTKNIFIALALMVAAVLLSAPMVSAASEGPQSVLMYTAPAKIKLDKGTFDCKIASHKFDKETGVGTVTFNGRLTTIGRCAFEDCSGLTSITIPNSVTSIGSYAFSGCTGELIVNCNIPSNAFANSEFTKVTIGDGVTEIGNYAFYNCSSLTSVTIPNSVTTIGEGGFMSCTGELIVNCNIPDASSYDSGVFHDSEFTKVTIGEGVTSIGNYAFYKCSRLDSITIPASVTSIGYKAFYNCSRIGSITIPASVEEIGEDAFGPNYEGTLCIYMQGATPPKLLGTFTNGCYSDWEKEWIANFGVYVPESALFDYRSADVWKEMADKIEPRY